MGRVKTRFLPVRLVPGKLNNFGRRYHRRFRSERGLNRYGVSGRFVLESKGVVTLFYPILSSLGPDQKDRKTRQLWNGPVFTQMTTVGTSADEGWRNVPHWVARDRREGRVGGTEKNLPVETTHHLSYGWYGRDPDKMML